MIGKKEKVYWGEESTKKGKELSKEEYKLFGWVFKYLKKKPEECTDPELEVQKIYKNLFIF